MSCLSGHLGVVAAPVGWRWHRSDIFEVGGTRLNLARSCRNAGGRLRQLRRRGSGTGIGSGFPNGIRICVPAAFQQVVESNVDPFPLVKLHSDGPSVSKIEEDWSPVPGSKQGEGDQQEQGKSRSFPPIVRFYPDDPNESKSVGYGNSETLPPWKAAEAEREQQGQERSRSFPPIVRFYPDEPGESNSVGESQEVVPRWKIAQAEREQQEREKRAGELARRRIERRQRELAQMQRDSAQIRERELGESSGEAYQGTQIGGFPSVYPGQQSSTDPASQLNPFSSPSAAYPSVTGSPTWPFVSNDIPSRIGENQDERTGSGVGDGDSREGPRRMDYIAPPAGYSSAGNPAMYAPAPVSDPSVSFASPAFPFAGQASGYLSGQDQKLEGGRQYVSQYTSDKNRLDTSPPGALAAEVVPVQQQAASSSKDPWPVPVVRFYPDDPSELKTVGDETAEIVPRWKVAQAEREQQEREKRAKELARRRIERKQREMAQRQKQIAEMREKEIADGTYIDPWSFGKSSESTAASSTLPGSTGTSQNNIFGAGQSETKDSVLGNEATNKDPAGFIPQSVGYSSTGTPAGYAPVPTTVGYPSGPSPVTGQASAGYLPFQDRMQGTEERQTVGSQILTPYTPSTNQFGSHPPGVPAAEAVPVQDQAVSSSNDSWFYPDDPSEPRTNVDVSSDSVPIRKITIAEREQQERERRARELTRRKVERRQREVAEKQRQLAESRARDLAEGGSQGWDFGGPLGAGYAPAASPTPQGFGEALQGNDIPQLNSGLNGEATSTDSNGYSQQGVLPSAGYTSPVIPAGSAPAPLALPPPGYLGASPPAGQASAAYLPVQEYKQDIEEGRQSGSLQSMNQYTQDANRFDWNPPGVPAAEVVPAQQQADNNSKDSWPIPIVRFYPDDPSESKINSGASQEGVPIRRLTQQDREQQERERKARELARRKMERKQRELAENQRQIAEIRARELAEGSGGPLQDWGYGGSPGAGDPYPKPPGSPTETVLAPPAAAFPTQTSSQGWEYGGSPTAAYPQPAAYPIPPGSSSETLLEPHTAAYTPTIYASPGSPTDNLLSDEEFFEHILLEKKQSEARDGSRTGETEDRDSYSGYGDTGSVLPSLEYPSVQNSSENALRPFDLPPPSYPSAASPAGYPSGGYLLGGDQKQVPTSRQLPEIVPRRRMTQAEREQEEREKRAKELARRRIERKQRELAQKQKEYAEERARELAENPEGASYNGGYVAASNRPLAGYPALPRSPFETSGTGGTSGTQMSAAGPGYYDSRNMYGQLGYVSEANKGLVSPGGPFLDRQTVTPYQPVIPYQPVTQYKLDTNQPEIIEEEMRIWDDLDMLLQVLPGDLREKLLTHPRQAELLEVVLDLGRRPEARFLGGGGEYWREEKITREDLQTAISAVGDFGGDNRAGIEGTLHRISAIRSRKNQIVGLTCRVGRAVTGQVNMVQDILHSGQSILFLGRPGVGKTTVIREMARVLSDKLHKRVVIVDTSNEIGGDGDVPHPAIGSARRMQVADPSMQHKVMVEAVENHMPEVVIVDEVGTEADAMACRTIAERGVMLVATAHGLKLENIIKNPTLCDLVGGVQTVILGDEQARSRGSQKSVLERKAPPTFPLLIEMRERNHWVIHQTDRSVDCLLHGAKAIVEVRTRDENFKVVVNRKYYDSISN